MLVGHQTAGELGLGQVGHDGLDPGSAVAANDTVDLKGGPSHDCLAQLAIV